jgi:signal peptidase
MKKGKKIKRASLFNIMVGVLTLIISAFAVSCVVKFFMDLSHESPLFGLNVFINTSELMDPAISPGSLIITRKKDPEAINQGEVITYRVGSSVMTQRVVEHGLENGSIVYYTKADADARVNPVPVQPEQILGVYQFSLNYLGGVLLQLQKPVWFALYLAAVVFLFSIKDLYRLIWARGRKQKRNSQRRENVAPSGNYFETGR